MYSLLLLSILQFSHRNMRSSLIKHLSLSLLDLQLVQFTMIQQIIDKLLQEQMDIMIDIVVPSINLPILHVITMFLKVLFFVILGKRFLDFPEKKFCCYCCNSTHGCGIVTRDWLKTANATYQGT